MSCKICDEQAQETDYTQLDRCQPVDITLPGIFPGIYNVNSNADRTDKAQQITLVKRAACSCGT